MSKCEYCDRPNEGNAGDYYHRKDCEARHLRELLKTETDPEAIKKLKAKLEMAEFVGD